MDFYTFLSAKKLKPEAQFKKNYLCSLISYPIHSMKSIVFFLLVCSTSLSFGQSDYGIKGGLSLSGIRGTNTDDISTLVGFNAGAVLKFNVADQWTFSPEILVSNKGYNDVLIPNGTTAYKLTYLSFPLMAEYHLSSKLYLQLGPELNFFLSGKMKTSSYSANITNRFNTFDGAIAGGPGIQLGEKLFLEGRYSFGLSQINKGTLLFGKHRTGSFQIDAVYLFGK